MAKKRCTLCDDGGSISVPDMKIGEVFGGKCPLCNATGISNMGKLRGELIELICTELGGDSEFDKEGGQSPIRDRAEEIVDDGILALAEKYDAFKY